MNISIICPVYNKEKFILDTIKSVEAQSSSNWELILIDDGSTDNTFDLMRQYLNHTNYNIVLYQRKDFSEVKGANSCRNIGAQLANYELLLFLDADDILLPNCIQGRLNVISKFTNNNIHVFGVAYSLGNPPKAYDKLEVTNSVSKAIKSNKNLQQEFLRLFLSFDIPWHTSGPIWNKQFFYQIGCFNINLQRLQDPEIHIRALVSKELRLYFATHKYGYDILHRKDDDRQIFDEHTFFVKQIDSIKVFLNTVSKVLILNGLESYKKYLINYLIFSETLCYKLIRDHYFETRKSYFQILNSLYNNNSVLVIPKLYLFIARRIIRPLENSKYFLKKKVPGLILILTKRIYS